MKFTKTFPLGDAVNGRKHAKIRGGEEGGGRRTRYERVKDAPYVKIIEVWATKGMLGTHGTKYSLSGGV